MANGAIVIVIVFILRFVFGGGKSSKLSVERRLITQKDISL